MSLSDLPEHFLWADTHTALPLQLLLYPSKNPQLCSLGSGVTHFVLFTQSALRENRKSILTS